MSQARESPRALLHLKPTACSEANSIHRQSTERSPKLDDRRSPRSPLRDLKKKASRVADLEAKLGQAQEEFKNLKKQLTAAEDARRDAHMELEETKKFFPVSSLTAARPDLEDDNEKIMNVEEDKVDDDVPLLEETSALTAEEDIVNCVTTDVFEVAPAKREESKGCDEDAGEGTETLMVIEEENKEVGIGERGEEKVESPKLAELRSYLSEKECQLERVLVENHRLKNETQDAKACSASAREDAEKLATKLAGAEEELNQIKMAAERLREKLELEEVAKATLESEMKHLRVQTEQWRKAAHAAAAVLAAGDGAVLNDVEVNGNRKLGESCRSMENHIGGYDVTTGDGGWSPVIAVGGGGNGNNVPKRRGGGGRIRVLGELWKKKGQMK